MRFTPLDRTIPTALLSLVAACGVGAAGPRRLDTTAVATIATELGRGLSALRHDSIGPALRHLMVARARNPLADQIVYLHAFVHLRAGEIPGVVHWLDTLAAHHSCLIPPKDGAFGRADSVPAVRRALERLADSAPATHASTAVASLPEWRDLFPEGIAYDPKDGAIYLSSLRRRLILRVTRRPDRSVLARPFTTPGRDTLFSVLGLDIDAARRRLWALTAAEGFAAGEAPEDEGRAAVLIYDLESGRTIRRIPIANPPNRLANDLALDSAGVAYVTDTEAGTVYRVAVDGESAQALFPFHTFGEPNGIEVTPDGRGLLVADGANGVWYVDLADRSRRRLPQPVGQMPLFLDGLALHDGALIGVSHALSGGWIVRFPMAPTWDTIRSAEILDCNHPDFRQLTTAVVAGDTLFFVATSQFDEIPPTTAAVDTAGLAPAMVMRLLLGR